MRPDVYREMASVQDRHWWFVARRQILDRVMAGLSLPADARIIEVGCGPGGNLGMLARHGHLQAMEADPAARRMAADLGVCPVWCGALPSPQPFAAESGDLICLFDVLEHIADDIAALSAAAALLRPGGRILLTVPAYDWLWSAHDEAHHHHRRYNKATLAKVVSAAGLAAIRVGHFNSLLFPLIAAARVLKKATGQTGESDAALPPPWLNTLLREVFALERVVIAKALFPVGTSLLAVLKRAHD